LKSWEAAAISENTKGGAVLRKESFVVLCASQEEAQRAYEAVLSIVEGKLHLRLHPEKTRIVHHKEGSFDFVGFLVHRKYLWPCIKSLEKFKERVRVFTRRQQPKHVRQVIRDLNPALRGFGNYFRVGDVKGLFEDLDGWIRMRLRCFIEKKKSGEAPELPHL